MSYSRWSNSVWYSFWSAGNAKRKEDEVFSLWADLTQTKDWTYEQLLGFTVEDIGREYVGITLAEAEEAWGYIQEFIADVDEEYDADSSQSTI
jgi:hypothetical protein